VVLLLFGAVYEVCRLGNHMPVGMVAGQSGPVASSSKPNLPGFTLVELPGVTYTPSREDYSSASSWSLAKSFVASMGENWSMDESEKSLQILVHLTWIVNNSAGSRTRTLYGEFTSRIFLYFSCIGT
jgi:hypothetical protein